MPCTDLAQEASNRGVGGAKVPARVAWSTLPAPKGRIRRDSLLNSWRSSLSTLAGTLGLRGGWRRTGGWRGCRLGDPGDASADLGQRGRGGIDHVVLKRVVDQLPSGVGVDRPDAVNPAHVHGPVRIRPANAGFGANWARIGASVLPGAMGRGRKKLPLTAGAKVRVSTREVHGLSRKRRPVFVNTQAVHSPPRRPRYIPLPAKTYGDSTARRRRSRFVAAVFGVRP